MRRLVSEFRWPLLHSGCCWWCSTRSPGWPGPCLVKTGIDNGVARRRRRRCCSRPSAAFLAGRARRPRRPDRRDVRDRPHQRADHAVAADPHLGTAPAALARLLRARDGRPDHDPDDDRRRPVRDADRERPALGPGLAGHLRRRRGRAAAARRRARRCGRCTVVDPAGDRDRGLPPRHQPPLRPGARVASPSSTPTSRSSLSGIREAQAFVHEGRTVERFHASRAALLRRAAAGPARWSRRTSRSCCSSPRWPT